MRRQDKELTDREAIEAVIRRARVCRVAMCDGDVPYVVPMSFGYRDGSVWLHCAAEGRKIDILRVNDRVCFEVDLDHATNRGEESCGWNLRYRSVIGFGRARIVEDEAGKREGLDVLMEQHGEAGPHHYKEKGFRKVTIIRIDLEELTGKVSGYDGAPDE